MVNSLHAHPYRGARNVQAVETMTLRMVRRYDAAVEASSNQGVDYDATPTTRFSLRDAARRPQVQSIWNQGSSFRHQSIGFVRSSGVVSPKTELDTKHGTIPPGFPPAIEQELRPTSASPAQQRLSPSSDGHLEAAEMDRPQLLSKTMWPPRLVLYTILM